MKHKIRAARTLILLLLVFATFASCVVTAGAIGWSGSSFVGSSGGSAQLIFNDKSPVDIGQALSALAEGLIYSITIIS